LRLRETRPSSKEGEKEKNLQMLDLIKARMSDSGKDIKVVLRKEEKRLTLSLPEPIKMK
jgi:hypothetical protein